MYMEHSALLQEFLHPPKASWATADPSTAGLIPVVPRSTRSIHDEHCSDPCCGSMIAKLQGDLSWMLAVHVGSGSKNGLALLFGVGGSGSRNGLALDEASACVELDAVPGGSLCIFICFAFPGGLALLLLALKVLDHQWAVLFIKLLQESFNATNQDRHNPCPRQQVPMRAILLDVLDIFRLSERMLPKHEAPHLRPRRSVYSTGKPSIEEADSCR